MNILHFVYLLVDGYLGGFHFLANINNGTVSIYVQVLQEHILLSTHLGVEVLGDRESLFNFLK